MHCGADAKKSAVACKIQVSVGESFLVSEWTHVKTHRKASEQKNAEICNSFFSTFWKFCCTLSHTISSFLRRGRDSNPRYKFKLVQRFSKPALSATQAPLQLYLPLMKGRKNNLN